MHLFKRKNIILFLWLLGFLVFFILFNLLLFAAAYYFSLAPNSMAILVLVVLLINIILIGIIILFRKEWKSKKYEFFKDRIVIKSGHLHETEEIIDIAQATVVNVRQGMIGKFFDYGDITIISRNGNIVATLDGVPSPERVAKIIEQNYENDKKEK